MRVDFVPGTHGEAHRYCLLAAVALATLISALLLNSHLVPAGDNSTYLVLGQSLAWDSGYRMISDPRAPQMALYPPGYPLLVAVVLVVTRTSRDLVAAVLPMKLVSVVVYIASIGVAYRVFRRRNPEAASATALMMALSPLLLHFSNEVGTESLFLLLSLLAVWLMERWECRPALAGLLSVAATLVAASYVRSVALVMALAFVIYLALRRRWRDALLLGLIVGLGVAPWFAYSSKLPSTGTSVGLGRGYFALYFSRDPYGTEPANVADVMGRILLNLRVYAHDILPGILFPHASALASLAGRLGSAFLYALSACALVGFGIEARRRRATEGYVALFFASCLGYLWAQSRLVVPLVPFAIYYAAVTAQVVLRALTRGNQFVVRICSTLLVVVVVSSALMVDARSVRRNLHSGLGRPLESWYARDTEWANYLEGMRWIAVRSTPSTVVVCRKADLMYVLTGLRSLEYPYTADAKILRQEIKDVGALYVIEDRFSWTRTTEQYLAPALQAWRNAEPGALTLAMETDAPRTRVWRINKLD